MLKKCFRGVVVSAKLFVAFFFAYNAVYGMAFPLAALSSGFDRIPPSRVITFWQILVVIGLYYTVKHVKKQRQGVNRIRNTRPIYQYTVGMLR